MCISLSLFVYLRRQLTFRNSTPTKRNTYKIVQFLKKKQTLFYSQAGEKMKNRQRKETKMKIAEENKEILKKYSDLVIPVNRFSVAWTRHSWRTAMRVII